MSYITFELDIWQEASIVYLSIKSSNKFIDVKFDNNIIKLLEHPQGKHIPDIRHIIKKIIKKYINYPKHTVKINSIISVIDNIIDKVRLQFPSYYVCDNIKIKDILLHTLSTNVRLEYTDDTVYVVIQVQSQPIYIRILYDINKIGFSHDVMSIIYNRFISKYESSYSYYISERNNKKYIHGQLYQYIIDIRKHMSQYRRPLLCYK